MMQGQDRAESDDGQEAAVARLLAAAVAERGEPAWTFETHGARVLVGPSIALKVKRPVRYAYMDFSTVEKRHAALARELEINQATAPELYRRLIPVTQGPDGSLALGGTGRTIDWVLEMRAFRQQDLLAEVAQQRAIGSTLAKAIADAVLAMHERAQPQPGAPGTLAAVVAELAEAFARQPNVFDGPATAAWHRRALAHLARVTPLLEARRRNGRVRRCHGDLHLGNIVLWNGQPTPFDALEFDEILATIDVLYDLAFLLMDLDQRGLRDDANAIMNRYLWRSGRDDDIDALAALPLMLSLRAGIRAMVAGQRQALRGGTGSPSEARRYFEAANGYLADAPARLVVIGGLSGTGKTTLAAAIAPRLGRAPGALHLRSDLERKTLAGIGELERLPPGAYTPESARQVYARLYDRARRALATGQSVIVDAVFAQAHERAEIARIAHDAAAQHELIWLQAPTEVLKRRVASRVGDASDATPDVVDLQLERGTGPLDWTLVEAGSTAEETRANVARRLGI